MPTREQSETQNRLTKYALCVYIHSCARSAHMQYRVNIQITDEAETFSTSHIHACAGLPFGTVWHKAKRSQIADEGTHNEGMNAQFSKGTSARYHKSVHELNETAKALSV